MEFPIDVSGYKAVAIDPFTGSVTEEQSAQLQKNIQIVRDTIIFFTAIAGIKGYAGHTGGPYDITPEVLIADAFMKGSKKIYPVCFDEAGHRVAIQYALAAFNGEIPFEKLLYYRAANEGLYGHPERDTENGVHFSSGRLGHMWPFVNGVAKAHPDQVVFVFGSDGSQMEGNDAEAARFAVAQRLNVKVCVDDNNVTIAGHPGDYMPGFSTANTLQGHGLVVDIGEGESFDELLARMVKAVNTSGPVALINRRRMAPGVPGIEGSNHGHDVIKKDFAIQYLTARGADAAVKYLNEVTVPSYKTEYLGSSKEMASNRMEFGNIVSEILDKIPADEIKGKVLVIDSDLEGSTGLNNIHKRHPEIFLNGGVEERGNLSAAAGFGFEHGKQGIFSTFSAFIEMVISEATMARLNDANLICHFSHAGVDEIADNTCHYGINIFLAHCGIPEGDKTRLYFAADALQLKALVNTVWNDEGIRYLFTTRSKTPYILKEDGSNFYGEGYTFTPGKDEIIREGSLGYVVSYGAMLYRALDAVERARAEGLDVGLINKPSLNLVDEEMLQLIGAAPFVLIVEDQNFNTGLGSRFGTWLLQAGNAPMFDIMAVTRPGAGGIVEHIPHQGLDPESILGKIKQLAHRCEKLEIVHAG